MKNIFIYGGLLLLMFLTLVGCTKNVGDCFLNGGSIYHVVKKAGSTVEIVDLESYVLYYTIYSSDYPKVDCAIAHEVIESNRKKGKK